MAVKKRKSKKNAVNNPGGTVIDLEETEKEMDSLIGQLHYCGLSDWSIGYSIVYSITDVTLSIYPFQQYRLLCAAQVLIS